MIARFSASLFLMLLVCGGRSASAHHSFAMFDMDRTVTLQAVVKEVQWANPHVWIDLVVASPGGGTETWGIEAGATRTLLRQGWKRDSLKPGDKVTVELHPMRNGSKAGSLIKVTLPDGQVLTLGAQGARPQN
jgi:hypothetical protein